MSAERREQASRPLREMRTDTEINKRTSQHQKPSALPEATGEGRATSHPPRQPAADYTRDQQCKHYALQIDKTAGHDGRVYQAALHVVLGAR